MACRHLSTTPVLIEARQAFEDGKIPFEAYQAFRSHVHAAKRRNIPFLFTIATWWNFWQTDSRWHHRGVGADKLVMARKGDMGPYSPENVFCCTHSQNIQLIDSDKLSKARLDDYSRREKRRGYRHHLAVRGDGHPRSKAIITPKGRFGSAALAAETHGITRAGAFYRLKRPEETGWRYETEAEKAPTPLPVLLAVD